MKSNYPKYLFRRDDGERFTLQSKGKFEGLYRMDKCQMPPDFKEYYYPYELLIRNGFKDSFDKCKIIEHKEISNSHD